MPMQVWPALLIAPQTAASAAAATSASSSTIMASLPPSSMSTGTRFSAHAAMTLRPVGADPVKASLSTPARHSADPVSPKPVTTPKTSVASGTAARHAAATPPDDAAGGGGAAPPRRGQPRADRGGVLGGLEDDGVAGGQCVRDRA